MEGGWIDQAVLERHLVACAQRQAAEMAELLRPGAAATVRVAPEYVERLAQLLEGAVRHYLGEPELIVCAPLSLTRAAH